MEYLLSVGLSFEAASGILQQLKEFEPDFANREIFKRLMLVFDESVGILKLKDFNREEAIAFVDKGFPVIPVWLDGIYQQLINKLKKAISIHG
ncbi:hypothetical protein [Gloeothece verrucosa]|uniref:hypothetical protein n=1 Tax=Gloeothece verrucosa TaxID=2546359 RepID=UPI0002F981AD|nr:hypothetical protein [Gloeothece verrucosa]